MSSPSSPVLQQFHRLDRSRPDFQDQLPNILYGHEYIQCEGSLGRDDLIWFVNYLDETLNYLNPSSVASRKCLRELRDICGAENILPTSYALPPQHLEIGSSPFASGGSSDLYKGTLDGSEVCIKRIRIFVQDVPQAAKAFCREAVIWKRLNHPNILSLLGITLNPFQLISTWVPGGSLPEYIQKHPYTDRLKLLCDVAAGLCYLHFCGVIHGDLKGPNILVEDPGHARIADFGLAKITRDLNSTRTASYQAGFTMRWAAPEVLSGEEYDNKADIFSLAMVMIEIFTGAIPFSDRSSFNAMVLMTHGERPPRPMYPTFTDSLWELMQCCWDGDPQLRPEASEVLQVILAFDLPAWKRLIGDQLSADDRTFLITSVFSDPNQVEVVVSLPKNDAQALVDAIDKGLDNLAPEIQRRCLYYSSKICGRHHLLPESIRNPLRCNLAETAQHRGKLAIVRKGWCNGREIAVKTLKDLGGDVEQTKRRVYEGVAIWKTLHHPNVLSLLGVTIAGEQFMTVSEWMTNGNVNEFIKARPDVNRLELLSDVTKGLIYMHDRGIAHGNLNGSNILVDSDGRARLAGHTLLTVVPDELITPSSYSLDETTQFMGSIQWSAPEILTGQVPSKEADIFALAMVFSGTTPFGNVPDTLAILSITQGKRPPRPTHPDVSKGLWELIERCWDDRPSSRPEAPNVLESLLNSNLPAWKRLIGPTLSAKERINLIISIFSDRDEFEVLKYLSGGDAQAFVDVIDEALDTSDSLPPVVRGRCLRSLYKICGRESLLPKSLLIPLCYNQTETPFYAGVFADVRKGKYNEHAVAIKVLRIYALSDLDKIRRRFCREAMTWKALRHPNISSLLGVTMTENQFAMVSGWMDNGNINEFVKARPDTNRLALLAEATTGLIYMHDQGTVHGNLKGSNILISNDGRACLADFGLITLLPGQSAFVSSYTGSGMVRWMSPESLSPDEFGLSTARPTRESDCYALGMMIYEVLSGRVPFSRYNGFTVVRKVLEGERPDKPEGAQGGRFPAGIWEMLERCWEHQPKDRPPLDDVLSRLRDTVQHWIPPTNTATDEHDKDEENEEKEDWDIDFDD